MSGTWDFSISQITLYIHENFYYMIHYCGATSVLIPVLLSSPDQVRLILEGAAGTMERATVFGFLAAPCAIIMASITLLRWSLSEPVVGTMGKYALARIFA